MKCQMVLLTLARYILELSLLDYKFVTVKESLKASAALFLAFNMYSILVDSKEFFKYTGMVSILTFWLWHIGHFTLLVTDKN